MKNIQQIIIILLLMLSTRSMVAQTRNNSGIPQTILNEFSTQYPQADAKRWRFKNGTYDAQFKLDGKKYIASYMPNGKWLNTITSIKWSWQLPPDVHAGFNHSKYAAWEINKIEEVQAPTGKFYRMSVDNGNLQIDAFHLDIFTKYFHIDFASNGKIERENNITDTPLAY